MGLIKGLLTSMLDRSSSSSGSDSDSDSDSERRGRDRRGRDRRGRNRRGRNRGIEAQRGGRQEERYSGNAAVAAPAPVAHTYSVPIATAVAAPSPPVAKADVPSLSASGGFCESASCEMPGISGCTWVGDPIPNGVGMPLVVLPIRPQPSADGKELKMAVDPLPASLEPSLIGDALSGDVSDALYELQRAFWGVIVTDSAITTAAAAGQIATYFVPGGIFVGIGVGVAIGATSGVTSAMNKSKGGRLVKDCSEKLAAALERANAASAAAAREAGSATCLVAQLCEQPVALNLAQAEAIMAAMDPNNKKGLARKFVQSGGNTKHTTTANRFPTMQLCDPQDERVLGVRAVEELEVEKPEHYATDIMVRRDSKDGSVKLAGSVVRTTINTLLYPVHKAKDYSKRRTANKRDAAGLPSYGDFIIRRFVVLTSVNVDEVAERKVLVQLPPVYAQGQNPAAMLSPPVVGLHPGERPAAMTPASSGGGRRSGRDSRRANDTIINVATGTSRSANQGATVL